jgi:ATP-dependent helicase/nuclease subunit A
MNLADALLLPQDDLALAVALKSPLFGLDDDDLFALAHDRKGSLRRALGEHAGSNEKFAAVLRRLEACEARAREETPFAFYAWLLGGDGGRARILRRLGHEANDALDEFLELALNYERKAPASLQGFMAWLRSADTEVKRDMEITRDEVRVMTVHGAKGLEASVVFMVDTTSSPADSQRVRLIHVPRGNGGEVVVWAGRKADDPKPVADARKAMIEETEDEYRRLLYVAMTRAADRLIVGGCMPGNMRTVRKLSWYDLIDTGLAGSGLEKQTIENPLGKVTRFARPGDVAAQGTPASSEDQAMALPSWLRTPAPRETVDEDSVRPSGQSAEEGRAVRTGESVQSRALALQRGTLVHRLLQSLPDIATERRREAALGFMARNASDWSEADRVTLADKVLALIAEPRFAAVFAAGSRAEVAIVGRLERPGRPPALVSGQIDRLVVTSNEVLIVDFKTNQTPPRSATEAPATYVRQLALYRAVLARLYPQTPIRAVLLWTETVEYMEISAPALDAALASLHVGVSVLDPARGRS